MVSSPLPAGAGYCALVPDFLSAAECQALIASSEGRGYASAATDYPPSYRNNDRHVVDAPDLAASLNGRLRSHAPASVLIDGRDWQYGGINERFRFCRYGAGMRFSIHQDGVHFRGPGCRSHLTMLVYLTDGDAFAGGDTVFYAQGPGNDGGPQELGRVRPRAGSLLLFDHAIWHAGAEVEGGIKHVLRSDVLYRADAADPSVAHQGYIWTLAALGGGRMASGGRDATIRIWDAASQPVRCLAGHTQSVLGLALLPGRRLASVSRDRTLRLWNLATGACVMTVVAHDTAVLDVAALPGGVLATAEADGLVKLWTQDGSAIGTLAGHTGWIWQLAALESGMLASASEDGTVRIWDIAARRCTAVLPGDHPLRALAGVDGALWAGDVAGRMTRWAEVDGWIQSAQFQAHDAAIRRLRHAGPGAIASCGEDCVMQVWDTGSGAPMFAARHANFVTDVLRCGAALVTSSYDGKMARHDHIASTLA
jgi:hypothetical protein